VKEDVDRGPIGVVDGLPNVAEPVGGLEDEVAGAALARRRLDAA
jgi:hypothetical protein